MYKIKKGYFILIFLLTILASCWLLVFTNVTHSETSTLLNLKIISLNYNITFDAEGSPKNPYAMEYIKLVLIVKNTGSSLISKDDLINNKPKIEADDFEVIQDLGYVINGGYWSPYNDYGLSVNQQAQIWITGYFKSSGLKTISSKTDIDKLQTSLTVLDDPGCYDSDDGSEHIKGWTIGTTACVNQEECITSTRASDSCKDSETLNEYVCQNDSRGALRKYITFVECPNGCQDGACIQKENVSECTDTDGGKDYFEKGTITVAHHMDPPTRTDYCLKDSLNDNALNYVSSPPENYLIEMYCNNNYGTSDIHECPNGCQDGACIQKENVSKCTDSDGGKDYEKKGTIITASNLKGNSDYCYNKDKLFEYWCEGSELYSTLYSCSFSCQNGICIQEALHPEQYLKSVKITPSFMNVNQQYVEFILEGYDKRDFEIYYQTEEDYKNNLEFINKINISITSVDENLNYTDIPSKIIAYKGRILLNDIYPDVKYYYRILHDNIIFKEGSFITLKPMDESLKNDLEIVDNSITINYLKDEKYEKARERFYAMIQFKYYNRLTLEHKDGKTGKLFTIKNKTTDKTLHGVYWIFGYLADKEQEEGTYLTKDEFGNFFNNGDNLVTVILDPDNIFNEINEDNNTISGVINLSGIEEVPDSIVDVNNKIFSPSIQAETKDDTSIEIKESVSQVSDTQISQINNNAKLLKEDKLDQILSELQELRNIVKEQETQIKYLAVLKKDVQALSEKVESAINNFITYGVDDNTKKLGAGERAAVIHSFKSAFKKLPETEEELADAIKIANGRWPSLRSEEAEKEAKEQFQKIYLKAANMDDPHDNAAITVMAYGLRQKAENRNLDSERAGIKIFQDIYGYHPGTTEDWNIMQAITYSGASRGTDTDNDLLLDEREAELGTDPNNPDSDGDGYSDGIEVANGYNPLGEGMME